MTDKAIRAAKLTLGAMLDKRRARTAKDRAGGQIAPSKYLPGVPRQFHADGGRVGYMSGGAITVQSKDGSGIFGEGAMIHRYVHPETGSHIEVLERRNGPASVLGLEVPEEHRGKGIGQMLQAEAMERHPALMGQVSSKAAATTAYRLGRRPYRQPDASLDDVFSAIDRDSSVNMLSPQAQPKADGGRIGYTNGGAADDDNQPIDLGAAREQKQVRGFHRGLMGDIAGAAAERMDAHQKAIDAGVFDGYEVGDTLQGSAHPMRITGRFVRPWKPSTTVLSHFDRMGAKPTIIEHNGKQYIPMLRYQTGVEGVDGFQEGDAYLDGVKAAGYRKMGGLRAVKADGGEVDEGFEDYLKIINPKGTSIDADARPNLAMGDMYGMLPRGSRQVAKDGPVTYHRSPDGGYYAMTHNPDIGERDVIGYAIPRGDETELAVVQEMQGKGIGGKLQYLFRKEHPNHPTGGLTEAGKGALRSTYEKLRSEGIVKADGGSVDDEDEGIDAYHGSPHDFDAFDISKLGTGEGAQAYGHGLYFAGNEGIAKHYKNVLSTRNKVHPDDEAVQKFLPHSAEIQRRKAALSGTDGLISLDTGSDELDAIGADEEKLHRMMIADTVRRKPHLQYGRMYKVKLRVKPHELLDWDKPLSEQPEVARRLGYADPEEIKRQKDLHYSKFKPRGGNSYEDLFGPLDPEESAAAEALSKMPEGWGNMTGKALHDRLVARTGSKKGAADAMLAAGIKGIRYLDAGSRDISDGDATHNYVMFHHDPVKVVDKYEYGGIVDRSPMFEGMSEHLMDDDGKPMELWHGTTGQPFEAFDDKKIGVRDPGFYGRGHYLTPDRGGAEAYADPDEMGRGSVMGPLHAALKNPYVWDVSDEDKAHRTLRDLQSMGIMRGQGKLESWDNLQRHHIDPFMAEMKRRGHDGVIYKTHRGPQEIVVFNPNMVKHRDAEVGDPNDPRIMRKSGGAVDKALNLTRRK